MFRNLSADPDGPVGSRGVEDVLTVLERGDIRDWGRLLAALDQDTSGAVRATLEAALSLVDTDLESGVTVLMPPRPPG